MDTIATTAQSKTPLGATGTAARWAFITAIRNPPIYKGEGA